MSTPSQSTTAEVRPFPTAKPMPETKQPVPDTPETEAPSLPEIPHGPEANNPPVPPAKKGSTRRIVLPIVGLALLAGLTVRIGSYEREPLMGVLAKAVLRDGPVPMEEIRAGWDARLPASMSDLLESVWPGRLDVVLHQYDDTGIWERSDRELVLTDLGRDFALVYLKMIEEGWLDDEI